MSMGLTSPGRRSPVHGERLVRLTLGLTLAGTLLGCARTAPSTGGPVQGVAGVDHRWNCEALEGTTGERWYDGLTTWEQDGGVMNSVHGTLWGHAGEYGRATEEDAVEDALASAASAALDLLDRRGLSYGSERRAEIEARTVETLLEGEEPSFPRVRIDGKVVERCRDEETGVSSWRARVLAEYPISHLKGDMVNATWERERLLRDSRVLVASAEGRFSEGRWLDGHVDLERARDAILATGVPLGADVPEGVDHAGRVDGSLDERIRWQLTEWRHVANVGRALRIAAVGGVEVVEAGADAGEEIEFLVGYDWKGVWVAAVGVPVRFRVVGGAEAILDGDPVTDESGTVRCRILRAYGEPGEYELRAEVDPAVVRAAVHERFWVTGLISGERHEVFDEVGPSANHRFFLVEGGHGLSICAELSGERDRDASQARAGFVQRMANDGYRTEACGPEVDVVVSGNVRLVTLVVPGSWTAEVMVEGTAFDQRSAREIAQTSITLAETSTEGQRDAELRALREAGRLLAVYLSRRILTSGE